MQLMDFARSLDKLVRRYSPADVLSNNEQLEALGISTRYRVSMSEDEDAALVWENFGGLFQVKLVGDGVGVFMDAPGGSELCNACRRDEAGVQQLVSTIMRNDSGRGRVEDLLPPDATLSGFFGKGEPAALITDSSGATSVVTSKIEARKELSHWVMYGSLTQGGILKLSSQIEASKLRGSQSIRQCMIMVDGVPITVLVDHDKVIACDFPA